MLSDTTSYKRKNGKNIGYIGGRQASYLPLSLLRLSHRVFAVPPLRQMHIKVDLSLSHVQSCSLGLSHGALKKKRSLFVEKKQF